MGRPRALVFVAAVLALVAAVASSPARPASKGCGPRGYAYAGLASRQNAFGVAGTLSATTNPLVERGHVAGWLGVGAPGEGPNGSDEWLQVGLNTVAGNSGKLYYEIAQPWGIKYFDLASNVPAGRSYRVAVLEMAGHANFWRVWVNGRPATRPIWLPESHGHLTPMAIAESWDGGAPACNRYAYRFGGVSLAGFPGGGWSRLRLHRAHALVMQDPGSRVVPASNGFVAVTAPPPLRLSGPPPSVRRAPSVTAAATAQPRNRLDP
jgi:hypothetical protein